MSKTIDEKVVEMRFDNRNFEKNVQVSLNTLDKLKEKVDMSKHTKSFDALGKAANRVSFDKMGKSIDAVKVKLSAMQIVGATVLSRLTNQVLNFTKKVENVVKDSLIGGGIRRAQNIENAHFMLQGLLKDEEKVQAVMADAMDSVDGTAYAYDEAAKAASQFAASGLEAGADMQQALRGITGVAAMTNSSYEDISRVFTTVAGNGRLMGDQLLQLSSRGMNAAATLAEYFGKSEQEIREMVSDGKISFKMFAEAMDDAFGEHAKKANDTFNGAMSNVKAALSRIGAKFVSPLIVQNGKLVESLNLIRMRINDINKKIDPIANGFVKAVTRIVSLFDRVTKNSLAFNFILVGIMHVIKNVGKVAKALGQAFLEMFPFKSQRETIKMAENFSKITKAMILTDKNVDKIKRSFKGVIAIFDLFNYTLGSIIKFGLRELSEILGVNNGSFLDTTANIGDMLVAFRDWVKEGDQVTKTLTKITDSIKKAYTWIKNITKITKGPSGGGGGGWGSNRLIVIANVFKTVFGAIKEYVTGGIEVLKKFIEAHKEVDDNFTLGDMIKDFSKDVLGYFFDIRGAIDMLIRAFDKLRNKSKNVATDIESPFKKIFEVIKTKTLELKNKYLPNLDFGSVFAIAFSTGVIVLLRKFGRAVQSLQKFLGQVVSPIKAVNKVLNTFAGTLAAYTKKLKAESVIYMATAIGILALSLKILADIPWNSLAKGVITIAALGGILVGFSAALGVVNVAISFSTLGKLGLVLGAFSGALLILSKALDSLSKVGDLTSAIGKMTLVGILLSSFIIVMGAISKLMLLGNSGIAKVGIAMIGFAAGLKILVSALKDLNELNDIKFTKEQAMVIAAAFIGFGAIIAASSLVDWKSAIGMLAMTVGIKIAISALEEIQNVDLSGKADVIMSLITIMGAMVLVGKFAGKNMMEAGIGIMAMASGVYMIMKTINIIKKLKPSEISKSLKAFAGIFLSLVPVIVASKAAGKEAHKAGLMILEISGAMLLMVASVALLGNIKTEKLVKGVAALSVLEVIFGILIALSKLGTATAESTKTILYLAGTVAAITGCIAVLTLLDQDRLNNATIALSGIMVVFGLFEALNVFLSSKIGSFKNMGIALGVMVGVITGLAIILGLLSSATDANANIKNATALSELLAVLTGCVLVMNNIKSVDFKAIAMVSAGMVEAFAIIVSGVELTLSLLGEIAYLFEELTGDDPVMYINKGIEIIGKVGEAIGTFFGSVASGFMETSSAGLVEVGSNLSAFWKNAEPFFNGIKNIDQGVAESAKNLSVALGALMIEGGVEKISKSPFLGWINVFANMGGGSVDLSGIETLGKAVKAFADSTKGIDESTAKQIADSSKAAAELVKIAYLVPRDGGKIEDFIGSNSLSSFGKMLVSFGKSLSKYGENVDGLKTDAINTSKQSAEDVISIAEMIPNAGGAIAFIAGDNDIGTFGIHIEQFGKSLSKYADSVTDLKTGEIKKSKAAAESLISVAELIPANQGVFQFFTGENNISGFGKQLTSFGESLVSYSEAMADFDVNTVSKSVGAVKDVLSIGHAVADKKEFKSMKSFGKNISDFADYLKDFDKKIKKINTDKMVEAAKVVNKLSGIFKGMTEIDNKAVKSFDKALTNVSITSLTKFIKDFSKSSKKFNKCGEEILINISKGMNSKKDTIKTGLDAPLRSAISAAKSYYGQFSSTGSYLVDGLVRGITNKLQNAYNAGRKLGSAADKGTRDAVEVRSPSRKAYEVGNFYVIGLCNALGAGKAKAKKIAADLGNTINMSLSKAITGDMKNLPNRNEEYINRIIKSLEYGSGALNQFISRYVKGASTSVVGAIATKRMAAAIKAYGKELYAKSSYAEQDAVNLANHNKTLAKLEADKKKLEKDIKKNSKKNDKDAKSRVKTLKNNLKTVTDQIKTTKDQIIQAQNDIASHTAQVYNEVRGKIADSVKTFMNPLALSTESGVDLFAKFEDNHSLLEQDKKNLEDYQTEYDELIKKREELQNEILKMEKINTTASRLNGKNLEKELSELDKLIEKQKSKIESTEESIAEHSSLTTTSILENMKSQVDNVTRYQNNLNKIINEGKVSSGLIEQLKEMGIQGSDYVDQFSKMTEDEIKEANRLYEESKKLSANTLTSNFQAAMNKATAWGEAMLTLQERGFNKNLLENLGDLGIDGSQYIDAFMAMTPEQISDFNTKYTKYLSIPDSVSDTVMMSFAKAGNLSIEKFIEALNTLNNPGTASNEALKNLSTVTTQSVLEMMSISGPISGEGFVSSLASSIRADRNQKKAKKAGKKTAKNVVEGTDDGFKDSKDKLQKTVDKNYSKVMETEVKKAWDKVKKTTGDGAKSVLTKIRDAWGIKSPSREAIKIVGYLSKGMTIGFDKLDTSVSKSALSAAQNVITSISNVLDADMDVVPTITPVIDLSEIQNGTNNLNNMFDGVNGVISLNNDLPNSMRSIQNDNAALWGAVNDLRDTIKQMDNNSGNTIFNNDFKIENPDPKAVATEVSNILQRQVDRRSREWA